MQALNLPDVFSLILPDFNNGVAQLVLGGTGSYFSHNQICGILITLFPNLVDVQPESVYWTPIVYESYYVVDLTEIDVGGLPISFDRADMGQVIVDR